MVFGSGETAQSPAPEGPWGTGRSQARVLGCCWGLRPPWKPEGSRTEALSGRAVWVAERECGTASRVAGSVEGQSRRWAACYWRPAVGMWCVQLWCVQQEGQNSTAGEVGDP